MKWLVAIPRWASGAATITWSLSTMLSDTQIDDIKPLYSDSAVEMSRSR
jgi:hypothetical protein